MPRAWLIGGLIACALFAGGVSLFSSDPLHRIWGLSGACAYAVAALAVLAWKSRATFGVDVALTVVICGAILIPLLWMVVTGHGEPEVGVVANSAQTLIKQGTPYKSAQALAATTNPNMYNPYLPLMAAFGVPQALFGHGLLTDPRMWFGVVFLVVFAFALRIAGARDSVRWALLMTASPVIAFELCVGGTDVPMVGFLCLGFALLYHQGRSTSVGFAVLAGLALGIASAMKATAWPALVVAVVLIGVRDGRKAAWAFAVTAVGVVAVCVGPFFALHPKSLVDNTIKFPLGLASVRSQASSPLLGHIIATTWHTAGNTVVVALLVLAAVAVGLSLVFRPPRSVTRAVVLLAGAMTLMFLLAPSTRFGYFIYPATLAIWLFAVHGGQMRGDGLATPDPDEPAASLRTSRPTIPAERPAA